MRGMCHCHPVNRHRHSSRRRTDRATAAVAVSSLLHRPTRDRRPRPTVGFDCPQPTDFQGLSPPADRLDGRIPPKENVSFEQQTDHRCLFGVTKSYRYRMPCRRVSDFLCEGGGVGAAPGRQARPDHQARAAREPVSQFPMPPPPPSHRTLLLRRRESKRRPARRNKSIDGLRRTQYVAPPTRM